MAWAHLKKHDNAMLDFNAALRQDPRCADGYYNRGHLQQKRGHFRAARTDYEKAIALRPEESMYRNQLAWLLATCPLDDVRDGAKAVEHATRGCELTQWKDGNLLDTLAAALAESGRFAEAVEQAHKGEALAPDNLRGDIRSHIQRYRAGKPVRSEPVAPPTASKFPPPKKRKKR
jgi:tetratricopeptide (TPR) repeat protein